MSGVVLSKRTVPEIKDNIGKIRGFVLPEILKVLSQNEMKTYTCEHKATFCVCKFLVL